METVLMNADGNREHAKGLFGVEIGDKNFDFATVTLDDTKVTGAQVAMCAGKHPVEDYVVLRHLKTGELETLRPTETSELDKNKVGRFFVVEGSDTHRFFVEGLAMEWPRRKLISWQIKFLVGA